MKSNPIIFISNLELIYYGLMIKIWSLFLHDY